MKYKQIKVYPLTKLEEAVQAAAGLNKKVDISRGNCKEDELVETFVEEARYFLTSKQMDYANYVPEDSSLPIIVMENSKLKVHDLARQAIMGKNDPTDIFNGEIDG